MFGIGKRSLSQAGILQLTSANAYRLPATSLWFGHRWKPMQMPRRHNVTTMELKGLWGNHL